ncbi:hypothetical protein C8F04DRAFT_1194161 [Mycena alexandri]|uniref:Uncharacterized protein n=1 Tax=Mycena alexandri TaxID=1745969 RepID=A0AAD6WQ05_9AGAR|nr:hypothetical protein C8F04DRAFT_1194161 [Mycena alexandri]
MYPDCGHLLKAQGTLRTTVGWVPRPADPISFSGRDSRLRQRQLGGMGVWSCPIEQTPIVGTFRPRHAPSSNRGPTPAATPGPMSEDLSQKDLIALVRRQLNRWLLTPGKLSKANKTDLKSKLLDPKYGFTTDKPAISGPI